MYIVPHFLKNEAKNLIKIKLLEIAIKITDDFIDNIFYPSSDNKYQELILNLDNNVKSSILNVIKEVIIIFDNLYLNSSDRKKYFNVGNHNKRSIITIFGLLEFERIYYYCKDDKNKHFYFIDTLFDLPSYDRYDKIVKGLAISNSINTNQKKGADITNNQINTLVSSLNKNTNCNISRQDIYLWIDKWNIPNVELDPIDTDKDTLYIMIDEKYIHEQIKMLTDKTNVETKNNYEIKFETLNEFLDYYFPKVPLLPSPKEKKKNFIMSKAFITFTDIDRNKGRSTLQNKVTFLTSSKNPWNEFMDFIPKIFDFKKIKTIKVLSDAGTWITAGLSNLKLFVENVVVPCLCEFHAKQKIKRSTKDENIIKSLNKYIDDDDKEGFVKLFNTLFTDKDDKRIKTLKNYKHYIVSHWNAIKNMKASKCKSSMESHISHNVAKYFSYEPKAYSGKHIQKLLKLRQHKENGLDIFGLYLKTCNNNESITLKKEELSFSIFEKNNSSNVPILYSSNSSVGKTLKFLLT